MPQLPGALDPNLNLQQQAIDAQMNQQAPAAPPMPEAPTYSASLLQNGTNKLVDVPQDDLEVAIRSGEYSPKRDAEFIVLDKYGNRNVVTGEHIHQALDAGMLLENSQQRHEREMQEQYGDSEVAAGIEGLTRGALTLPSLISKGAAAVTGNDNLEFTPDEAMVGLSNLSGGNLTPESLRGRAEANPVSSFVGDVAGQIGGFGASGATKGASALEKQVAKTVLKDAAKAGLPKKIAASLAAKAAGSAVEGAYFGAGQLVSEDSIGKADFNAENLAIAMGTGAIINGALGTAIGAASEALPLVKSMAKMATKPAAEAAELSIDQQVAAGRLLGLTPRDLAKLRERNPKVLEDIQNYLKDDLKLSMTDTAENLLNKNEEILHSAGSEIESALKEMDAAFEFRRDLMPKRSEVWNNVYNKISKAYEDWLSGEAAAGGSKIKRPVENFLKDVKRLSEVEGTFGAQDLQKIKKMQDELLNYEKSPGKWTVFEDLVHTTRSSLKEEIDSAAQRLYDEGTRRDLAMELREANRKYSSAATFSDFIDKRALKAGDRNWSIIGTARDLGLDVTRKLAVLGKLEGAKQVVEKAVDSAIKGMLSPKLVKAGQLAKQYTSMSIMDSAFAKKFENGKYKSPKSESEAYVNLQDNFNRYMQDPEAFTRRLNRSTSSIYNQAPNTSTALDTLGVQAGLFLASKLPKRSSNPGMLGMQNVRPPSKLDLAKFSRYLDAVERPQNVFRAMENGRLSHEHVEAIKSVYPQLYFQMQNKALEGIKKHPHMNYQQKLKIGLLLDVPADESMLPENVLGLQANFHKEQSDEAGAVNPTVGGMGNLNIAERSETDTQSLGEA